MHADVYHVITARFTTLALGLLHILYFRHKCVRLSFRNDTLTYLPHRKGTEVRKDLIRCTVSKR